MQMRVCVGDRHDHFHDIVYRALDAKGQGTPTTGPPRAILGGVALSEWP